MSSLRNAVKRVTHKERSQPQYRAHLGILEKKKDYVKRARDYHNKQEKLRILREKADHRNPDEFYFGMHNSKIDGFTGKHVQTEEARRKEMEHIIGDDAIRLMKQQDLSAIKLQIQKDTKRIEKLRASLHMIGVDEGIKKKPGKSLKRKKHTVFVDDEEELNNFDLCKKLNTVPELVGRAYNRPKLDQLENSLDNGDDSDPDFEQMKLSDKQLRKQEKQAKRQKIRAAKARASSYRELESLEKRKEQLLQVESHLETEKMLRGKGRRRKVRHAEGGKPAVYKWDNIRKK